MKISLPWQATWRAEQYKSRQAHIRREIFLVYYDGSQASSAALKRAIQDADQMTQLIAVAQAGQPGSQVTESVLAAAIVNAESRGKTIQTQKIEGQDPAKSLSNRALSAHATRIYFGLDGSVPSQSIAEALARAAPADVIVVRT